MLGVRSSESVFGWEDWAGGAPKSPRKYERESGFAGADSSLGVKSATELLTLMEIELELPPPGAGFTMLSAGVPAMLRLAAGRVATISVGDTYVEVIRVELNVTVEAGRKFDPSSSI